MTKNKVTIAENALDPSTWQTFEDVEDVREFLVDHFGIWPETAHIYLDHVANNADITPYDEAGIERLGKVNGHFFVVVYPAGIVLILVIVAIVIAAVAVALVFLLRPSANTPNQQNQSANNKLGDRQNEARPNERIPDIFGQVQSTFDLLSVPYRLFVSNQEIEHCYMCVGRGSYTIDPNTICDGITRINQTDGASIAVFAPNTSPNSVGGPAPVLTLGPAITEKVVNLQVFDSVNGQILRAPNAATVSGPNNIAFSSPNEVINDGSFSFTDYFNPGDSVTIGNGGIGYYSNLFAGTYIASAVTSGALSLVSPQLINPRWSTLVGTTPFTDPTNNTFSALTNNASAWVPDSSGTISLGKFFIPSTQMTEIWCNFVCEQGSYYVDKNGNQNQLNVTVEVGITPADPNGNPILGAFVEQTYSVTIQGSPTNRSQIGASLKIVLGTQFGVLVQSMGGILIRAKRTSNTVIATNTTTSDQTQWRDCYIVSHPSQADFGNVTTIQTIIRPTLAALAVKERKLNAIVTRNLPALVSGVFTGSVPTKNAADIICAMALDPFIGNRTLAELDVTGIYAVAGPGGAVQTYFSVLPYLTAPNEFCYTFDDAKVSFEESLADIAQAIFCVAYRRGSVLTLSFEQQTENSTLLFNHRNKIPGSETRSVSFGTLDDNDGISLDYIEPNAPNFPGVDTTLTLYFPPDQSAVNPKKVTSIGIRNQWQAQLYGWRLYQKLIYQNTSVEFDATEEAALLVLQDRIAVADNTRSDTQDGEVQAQAVLLLTLSHNVTFDARFSYTIFLQHPDETVEAIPITAGANPNQVILGFAPTLPCVIDPANYANTIYHIVSSAASAPSAFLLSEKTPKANKTYGLQCINYSDHYYDHDVDYKTDVAIEGLYLEVMTNAPGANVDVEGFYLEVMTNGPGAGTDIEGLFLEVMTGAAPPRLDVEGLYLEVMTQTPPPNMDVDGLYLEVMYH